MNLLFSIIVLMLSGSAICSQCYWNNRCSYRYFSSKTPYHSVRGDIRDNEVKLKDCEPISIWGIYRHGKVSPDSDTAIHMREAFFVIDDIVSSYAKGNCSLCAQDVENLENWRTDDEILNETNVFTDEGFDELFGLGYRLKQTFPALLTNLQKDDYTFRRALGNRMKKSAKAFVKGLADKVLNIEKAHTDFDILSPYTVCGKYQKRIREIPEHTEEEVVKYLNTSDYLMAKDRIQKRIGLNYTLSDVNITALYDLCRYTTVWLEAGISHSPWCGLFTTEDLEVMEYIEDLKHYYRNGYGLPYASKFGRITLTDLLDTFQLAKNGKGKKITAYFTHDTMMDMIVTALGLFQDKSLLTGEFRDPLRKWRSSIQSISAANLVAVLSRCTSSKADAEDHRVTFYLNEEPLLAMCQQGVCSWQEFEETLALFRNTSTDFCE